MAKGRRVLFPILTVAGVLVVVGYASLRPRWRTATEAEVRAQIDPRLLETPSDNPPGIGRFWALQAAAARIQVRDFSRPYSREEARLTSIRLRNGLAEVDAILGKGPLQHPRPADPDLLLCTEFLEDTRLVGTILRVAPIEAKLGRRTEAVMLLRYGHRLIDALYRIRETDRELEGHDTMAETMGLATMATLGYLREPELKQVADMLPPSPSGDRQMQRVLLHEYQSQILPQLPDPVAWSRSDPDRDDDSEPFLGSYDAIETARLASQIYLVALENAMRQRQAQDASATALIDKMKAALPVDPSVGANGWTRWVKHTRFRWDMTRLPNSFGQSLLISSFGPYRVVPPSSLQQNSMDGSFERRTEHEALRTLVALYRYRLKWGRRAPSLPSLVKAGFLESLPYDHCGKGPLRYDPKRSRLWSVGLDGADDGGIFRVRVTYPHYDILYFTP